jgi:CheY-like chemotaxis protein
MLLFVVKDAPTVTLLAHGGEYARRDERAVPRGLTQVTGSSSNPRVLVIDDMDEMRILIRRALSASGYEVDVAASLAQARALDPAGYDVVLVDAGLGREQGAELIEALRTANPAAAGRCLMMTGGATDTIPDGVARLTKPFKLDQLLDAVHALQQIPRQAAASQPAGISPATGPVPAARPVPATRAAAEPGAWRLLSPVRRLRTRERHELVGFLHDGPIQELTAASLDLQVLARSAGPELAQRLAATLRQLDTAAGSLRWLVDGPWPFLPAETGLAGAVRQRTAWLLATPVTMDADEAPDGLSAAEIAAVVDIVELMLVGILPASPHLQARVSVQSGVAGIQIGLVLITTGRAELAASDRAPARAALDDLAAALGATAHADLGDRRWQARILLPGQAKADPFKKVSDLRIYNGYLGCQCEVPGRSPLGRTAGGGSGRDGLRDRGRADRAGQRSGGAAVRIPARRADRPARRDSGARRRSRHAPAAPLRVHH